MSLKKLLKLILFVFTSLVIAGTITFFILDEAQPEGKNPSKADKISQQFLLATKYENWKKTGFVEWTFAHNHHYIWDRSRNYVLVEWDDFKVLLDTKKLHRSLAYDNGTLAPQTEQSKLVDKAWEYFCNDSFWLCAHYKIFDPGTKRFITTDGDLMVQYMSGGVTPGDIYVWKLNTEYFPQSFKMWVKIIPIGGLEADWSNLIETETGAHLASSHSFGPLAFSLDEIKTAKDLKEVYSTDPFQSLN